MARALVILAANRARQLALGGHPLVVCDNKSAVSALREIGAGKVRFREDVDVVIRAFLREKVAADGQRRAVGVTARDLRDRARRAVSE